MSAPRALLIRLMALGEITVGTAIAVFPSIGALLIGAPIDGSGILITRMLGVAVLVVGVTWWLARAELHTAPVVPGFLLYNFGVGALFALAAGSTAAPLVPGLLAAVHLVAAVACIAITLSPQQHAP